MNKPKSLFLALLVLMAACTTTQQFVLIMTPAPPSEALSPTHPFEPTQTQTPTLTSRPTQSQTPTRTATPKVLLREVTRIVTPIRTVIVTTTPTPYLAKACFDQAMTQVDINSCAAEQRALAEEILEKTLAQIDLPVDEKTTLGQMQAEWLNQAEQDCEFFYGKIITSEDGFIYYARGSMAPMLINMCIANRIEQHILELKYAYLTDEG